MVSDVTPDQLYSLMKEYSDKIRIDPYEADKSLLSYDDLNEEQKDCVDDLSGYAGFNDTLALIAVKDCGFFEDQGKMGQKLTALLES